MGMKSLSSQNQLAQEYPGVLEELQAKLDGQVNGVVVDVSVIRGDLIQLSFGDSMQLVLTPGQAVDLMRELRRAIVKTNPRALKQKVKA